LREGCAEAKGAEPNQEHPAREASWLPAPKGPFFMAMRLYWPKEEALSGKWTMPKLKRAE